MSLMLFFIPSIFIGLLLPIIIEILALKTRKVGSAAGNVYSVSTAGSIIGTLFVSFYLISWMGVSNGIVLLGSLLAVSVVVCLVYHLKSRSLSL